jgi:hypothetical protein
MSVRWERGMPSKYSLRIAGKNPRRLAANGVRGVRNSARLTG